MSSRDKRFVIVTGLICLAAIVVSSYKIAAMAGFMSISLLLMGIEEQL